MSLMAMAAAVVLCGLSIFYGFRGEKFMGRPLGGDFVAFYVTGRILNEYQPARIYDLGLEVTLQHETLPGMSKDDMLPFAHAPYVAQIYRPFALLPYKWAYIDWLIFSLGLYTSGLLLLLRSAGLPAVQSKTGFLLGLGSMAFLLETWIGGQLSVIGFFVISLFVYLRSRGNRFWAGLVLAFVMYKLTLIAIPALMLFCGRRWRMLAGLSAGVAAVACLSLATAGVAGCVAWYQTLGFFQSLAMGPLAALRRAKYVDAGSFFHLLLGPDSSLAQWLSAVFCIAGLLVLALAWWRSSAWDLSSRDLLWAATFAGSLVFNVYSPIYDTIVAGAAVALAARPLSHCFEEQRDAFGAWLLLLYMVPWLTQAFAEFLHFQLLTLVLAGFAYWALALAQRNSTGQTHCPDGPKPAKIGVTSR